MQDCHICRHFVIYVSYFYAFAYLQNIQPMSHFVPPTFSEKLHPCVLTADSRWFVVYGALIAGVAFVPGRINLQPYLQVGTIFIISNVTSCAVKLLGLF